METIVMKFGGASVATPQRFAQIANLISSRKRDQLRIVVVVSAMGNTTDQLIALAKEVNPNPPIREYDMLITVGERISISLLAMALARKNQEAVSFTGSQSGIITTTNHSEARIVDVKPHRVITNLEQGKIVIVAGFQGVSTAGEITTLGRGGSDTTAVALGVALKASRVEFYKDVSGIYEADPKQQPNAKHLATLSFREALSIVNKGAKILHARCLELAQINCLPLYIRSFEENLLENKGTWIHDPVEKRPEAPLYEREVLPV